MGLLAVGLAVVFVSGAVVALLVVRPVDRADPVATDTVRHEPADAPPGPGDPAAVSPALAQVPVVPTEPDRQGELLYLKAMREVDGVFGGIELLGNPPPVDADRVARVPEQLRAFEPAAGRSDLRGWEWYYLRGLASASRLPAGSQSLVRRLTVGPAELLPGLNTLAWSPDSRQVAAVLTDGQVVILPVAGGAARRLGLANDRYHTAAWSPDSSRLAIGTGGGRLLVWDADGKELVAVQAHTAGVAVVAWSADGRRLATGTDRSEPVKVWEAATGAAVRSLTARTNESVRGLAWSPDGRWLAAAAAPPRVWDTGTGAAVHEGRGSALSVAWTPDSRRLAVSGEARTRVLDAGTWQETLSRSSGGRVAFSPDGGRLAVLGEIGLLVLDGSSGKELATTRRHQLIGGPIEFLSLRWRPDGQQVLVGPLTNPRPMAVDATTGQPLPRDPDHPDEPSGRCFPHPDGRRAVSLGADEAAAVELWDVPDRRRLRVWTIGRGCRCVAWAADGRTLATGEASGLIRLWDPGTGRERAVVRGIAAAVIEGVTADPRTYKMATHNTHMAPGVPLFGLAFVAFSPDGKQLAALTAAGEVWVWAADDGRQLGRWSAGDPFPDRPTPFFNLAWSPDGRELALRAAKAITVRDALSGKERLALPPDGEVVAWSPDGTRLAAGRGDSRPDRRTDRPVPVWDARTGKLIRTLADPVVAGRISQYPPEGWPAALAWSPDSRRLAVADASFFTAWITVWDPDTGDYLATARVPRPDVGNASPPLWGPPRAPHNLHPLAWSPDGWKLAAAGLTSNAVATIWDATPPGATGPLIRSVAPPSSPPPSTVRPESADAVRQAYKAVEAGEWEKADKLLAALRPAAGEPDRRGWEWQFVHALAVRQSAAVRDRRLTVPLGEVKYQRLVWSADGRRLAGLDRDRGVQLMDAATGAAVQTIKGRFARMALSPDARRLATLGAVAAVWDTGTGKKVAEWPAPATDRGQSDGRPQPLPPLAWNADGTRLALPGAEPGTVRVWDAGEGTETVLRDAPAAVTALAWSQDGKQLAGGCKDGAVRRWEVATGQPLPPLGSLDRRVWTVAWSPDGKRLVAAAGVAPDLSTLRVYDLATGNPVWEATRFGVGLVHAHFDPPSSDDPGLAWTPDGSQLLLYGGDPVGVIDAATGRPVHTVLEVNSAGLPTFSPDGRRLSFVPTRSSRTAAPAPRVLEAATSRELARLGADGVRGRPTALAWSPDGGRLAIAAGPPHAALEVWDATGGTPPVQRRLSEVAEFDWHPDGRRLIAIDRNTRTPAVVPVADLPPVNAAPPPPPDRGRTLALSPDGKRVAAVVGADRLSVWETAATKPAWEVVVPHQWPSTDPFNYTGLVTLDWSPSGRRLAALGADRAIRVWDAADGREVTRLGVGHANNNGSLSALALSPDDRRLAYVANHHDRAVVFVHDLPSGGSVRAIEMAKNRTCSALAWSPDGRHLAAVVDPRTGPKDGYNQLLADVYDANSGAVVTSFPFDLRDRRKSLTTVSWSPDGKRLCLGTAVLELTTGARVPLAAGPKTDREADPADLVVVPAVWRPDGTQLALLGRKDVRVFDAADGSQVSATPIPAVAAVTPRPLAWTGAAPRYWTAPADPAVPPPLRSGSGPPPSAPRPEQRPQFPNTRAATVSPDGKHLAVVSDNDQLTVTDVATGKVVWDEQYLRRLAEPADPPGGRERYDVQWSGRQHSTVYWAPDSRRLAVWTTQGLWLLDLATRWKGNRRVPQPTRPPYTESDRVGFAWSPDGRRLAGVFCKGESLMVSVLDTTTLRETFTHAAAGPARHPGPGQLGPPPPPGVAWHPDGNRLAVSLEAVEVWDTAARRRLIVLPAGGTRGLAWTPDGKRLLARGPARVGGGFDTIEELTVWDGETDTPLLTVRGPATAARLSRDGRFLATGPTDDHAVVVTEVGGP